MYKLILYFFPNILLSPISFYKLKTSTLKYSYVEYRGNKPFYSKLLLMEARLEVTLFWYKPSCFIL